MSERISKSQGDENQNSGGVGLVLLVFRLFADHDIRDSLFWKYEGDGFRFFVNVNDVFYWGAADLEEITEANLDMLKCAIDDCEATNSVGEIYGGDLFAARLRKCRPQGASYPQERELWSLFDACGPEREVGFGNPYRPGEYSPHQAVGVPEIAT